MLAINSTEVRELLSVHSCMQVMKTALADLTRGEAEQNLRMAVPIESEKLLGLMPGYLKNEEIVGTKVISVFHQNKLHGLPSHQGAVLLFDSKTGRLLTTVDGGAITAIRTAAVSGAATEYLAKKDAKTLCILGSGEQAKSHLEAMVLVRPIKTVKIWSRRKENAIHFKKEMEEKFQVLIEVCDSAKEAAMDADIICTVTASKEPILKGEWVSAGAHVNAVGACSSNERELDSELVRKSRFYVDRVQSAIHESGDYLFPLKEGVITRDHILGEIGQVFINEIAGRTTDEQITIFKSLGLAIEDLAAANFIFKEAIRGNKGTHI